ncbi:MAG: glycogen/starch/alpha-glucan phosphorylase [Candidatus Caldarchaeum sp.]|nr:glycogen/starch/alpha-glucan phosphorylase [Candidatus Caldarchaeum sp.]
MVVVSLTPEIALDEIPVYAGGLGVLEGDKFYAAAEKNRPYVVLTPFYPKGYVEYVLSGEDLIPHPQKTEDFLRGLSPEPEMHVPSNRWGWFYVRPYAYVRSPAKVVFLHVVHPEPAAAAVERLYVYESEEQRDIAAVVFAKAAAQYIRERIGVGEVRVLDLQESWGSLVVQLLAELVGRTRFIVHTIAPWTNLTLRADIVKSEIQVETAADHLSLWNLSSEKSTKIITVSAKHEELVKKYSENYAWKTTHITNGVYLGRWVHPEISSRVGLDASVDELASARERVREMLRSFLKQAKQGLRLDDNTMVVAWPRRITRYKRPYFVERLVNDVGDDGVVVFALAGKAHPKDGDGQHLMKRFLQLHREHGNVVYIPSYDLEKAKLILAGSDLLLFTPFPAWEACGTSYMKAGVNGVPTLSSRDGGALEIIQDGVNGWLFGSELSHVVNIYTDHEAVSRVDQSDYADLLRKFKEIRKVFAEKPREYREVQLRAFETMRRTCSVDRALEQYYG